MVQFSNSIETVVANYSDAMKSRDHFKNGASSKSHTIRGNFLKIISMMFVLPFLLVSCGKNEMDDNSVIHDFRVQNVVYAKGSKLKNISYVESVKSKKGGIIINQYEYDERGRISKVSQPMYEDGTPMFENGTIVGLFSYSDYVYNDKGLLDKIIYYHSNIYAGFQILETRTYSYDKGGNKLKEVVEYPLALPFRTDSTLYYYDNNRLMREDKYSDGYHGNEVWSSKLTTYIEYEYDNQGNLVKENYYSGIDTPFFSYSSSSYSSGTNKFPYSIIKHIYQNGLNIKTEIGNVREIRRYYDKNGNLIYLESEELSPYSSAMSCVTKYEYY